MFAKSEMGPGYNAVAYWRDQIIGTHDKFPLHFILKFEYGPAVRAEEPAGGFI